jgi:hypothetical protein
MEMEMARAVGVCFDVDGAWVAGEAGDENKSSGSCQHVPQLHPSNQQEMLRRPNLLLFLQPSYIIMS